MATLTADGPIDEFITRWAASEGAERANFQPFAEHLCEILGVAKPAGSVGGASSLNTYTYERAVKFKNLDGSTSPGRIDLYKKDCFVLEAKQSRWKGGGKAIPGQADLFQPESVKAQLSRGGEGWETLMANAHRQATDYVRDIDPKDIWADMLKFVKARPAESLAAAVVVGFLVGRGARRL